MVSHRVLLPLVALFEVNSARLVVPTSHVVWLLSRGRIAYRAVGCFGARAVLNFRLLESRRMHRYLLDYSAAMNISVSGVRATFLSKRT
jgi:hypothetical protein